jgi:hypothetical protein
VIPHILLGIISRPPSAVVARCAVHDGSLLMQDEIVHVHALDQVSAASNGWADGSHIRAWDEAVESFVFQYWAIRWDQFPGIYFIVCNYRLLLLHWMSQDFIGDVMLRHMDVFVAFSFPSISRKLIRKAALFKSIFISSLVPFVYTMDFLNK